MNQIAICFLFFGLLFIYIGLQAWCICNQRSRKTRDEEQKPLLHV